MTGLERSHHGFLTQRTRLLVLFGSLAASFIRLSAGGDLYASEVCLALIAMLALSSNIRIRASPTRRRVVALLLIWAVGQLLSDLINGRPLSAVLKGQARIDLAALAFIAFWLLLDIGCRREYIVATGLAMSGFLSYAFQPTTYERSEPWKFGMGYAATFAVISVIGWWYPKRTGRALRTRTGYALLLLAALHIYLGARSLGLVVAITGVVLLVRPKAEPRLSRPPKRRLRYALVALIVLPITYIGYTSAAKSGYLGRKAQVKLSSQDGRLGVLVGGRPEIIGGVVAILKRPAWGYGSYAPVSPEILTDSEKILDRHGYQGAAVALATDMRRIPTHSHLLQAWAEGGLLALPFWIFVLCLCWTRIIRAAASAVVLPVTVLLGVNLIWDTLFSPYGGDRVMTVPLTLAFLTIPTLDAHRNHRQRDIAAGPLTRPGLAS